MDEFDAGPGAPTEARYEQMTARWRKALDWWGIGITLALIISVLIEAAG